MDTARFSEPPTPRPSFATRSLTLRQRAFSALVLNFFFCPSCAPHSALDFLRIARPFLTLQLTPSAATFLLLLTLLPGSHDSTFDLLTTIFDDRCNRSSMPPQSPPNSPFGAPCPGSFSTVSLLSLGTHRFSCTPKPYASLVRFYDLLSSCLYPSSTRLACFYPHGPRLALVASPRAKRTVPPFFGITGNLITVPCAPTIGLRPLPVRT